MGNPNPIMNKYQINQGFPGRSVVKNPPASAGDEFDPWSKKTPHVMKQLNPWVPTTEPVCALEPVSRNFWALELRLLKPTWPRAYAPQWEATARRSPCTTRETPVQQRRPSTAKHQLIKLFFKVHNLNLIINKHQINHSFLRWLSSEESVY